MRPLFVFSIVTLVAACGLDVIGKGPSNAPVDDLDAAADSGPIDSGATDADGAGPDDGGTLDLLTGIQDLRTIALKDTKLYVGTGGATLLYDLGASTTTPIAVMNNVNAFFFNGTDVVWASRDGLVGKYFGPGTVAQTIDLSDSPFDVVVTPGVVEVAAGKAVYAIAYTLASTSTLTHSADHTIRAIATNGTNVAWADFRGEIVASTPDGTSQPSLGKPDAPTSVLADGDTAVFTTPSTVETVTPLDSNPPTLLADNLAKPVALAQDGEFYYWVGAGTGRLNRVKKSGGAAEPLLDGKPFEDLTYVHLIAFDAQHIYVAQPTEGRVVRMKKP